MAHELTQDEQASLRRIAALMIPASAKYNIPGADDDRIFADIQGSFGRDAALVKQALQHLHMLAGGAFATLPAAEQDSVAAQFRTHGGEPLAALSRIILQCYYRDDRVMRSLNMDPRPPFPKGHTVEQGDWSLLDPVRARPKLWRDAP
jgi:hypothetical protein